MKLKLKLALAALAALPLSLPLSAGAQPQPYAGKTVTIVVGYKAGGGYDATARLLARHLPKHLPGKPTMIVQNMPGANSLIAANHVYSVAKPDGLTIGTFNRNVPIAQLTKAAIHQGRSARFRRCAYHAKVMNTFEQASRRPAR